MSLFISLLMFKLLRFGLNTFTSPDKSIKLIARINRIKKYKSFDKVGL